MTGIPRLRPHVLSIGLTLAIAAIIAGLTLTQAAPHTGGARNIDKLYHVIAFGALVVPTIVWQGHRLPRVAVLAVLYGGAIEILQNFVGREMEFGDFLANAVGVGLVTFVGMALQRARKRRR